MPLYKQLKLLQTPDYTVISQMGFRTLPSHQRRMPEAKQMVNEAEMTLDILIKVAGEILMGPYLPHTVSNTL